jgi:phosphatidylinositol dimannoside acyltransferase
MPIDLQQVINSRAAVRLVSFLGQVISPGIGYPLCDLVANWVATRRDSKVIQAARVNQWMVHGANLEKEALDKVVWETFRNNARNLYDLYHYVQSPEAEQRIISLNPVARSLVERPEFGDRGLVIVGLHLSNFDLVLQSICRQGFKAMVLTLPDPQGARRMEYERRRRTGMNLIPASLSALRQAVNHLERGGMVLTSMDRPVSDPKYCPRFFGRGAPLPIHSIYLASKAHVPVVIMAAIQRADRKYHVVTSEPIEMESYPENVPDYGTQILRNSERVLSRVEDFIRLAPQQWNMFLPVWPDMLERVPI